MSDETNIADFKIPLWGKALIFGLRFIPFVPSWVKDVLPLIFAVVDSIPWEHRQAVHMAAMDKDATPLIDALQKHCTPGTTGCPSGLVKE